RVARAHLSLATRDPGGDHLAKAEELAKGSVQEYERILVRCPSSAEDSRGLFASQALLAEVYAIRMDAAAAATVRWEWMSRSPALHQRFVMQFPKNPQWDLELRMTYNRCRFNFNFQDDDEALTAIVASPEAMAQALRLAERLIDIPTAVPAD